MVEGGCKVVLIDDEADTILMRWFIERLRLAGCRVEVKRRFAEAVQWMKQYSAGKPPDDLDFVILDIMFPLRAADSDSYREITGREPGDSKDAMEAGLALLPHLKRRLEGIPITVLTGLPREIPNGLAVHEALKAQGVRVFEKPADDSFFEYLLDLAPKCFGETE